MLRATLVCAAIALIPTSAAAQDWPEPERPINQPTFVDLGLTGYFGSGYDGGFEGDGAGARASMLIGAARPRWAYFRGTYHLPTGDDPSLIQLEFQVGRSLWHTDCAHLQDGRLRAHVPVYGPGDPSTRRVRQYQALPLRADGGNFRFASDLVLAGGARMFMFIGDNPDTSHVGVKFIPQLGLWWVQQHVMAGRPGHLRVALLGAYQPGPGGSYGVFFQAEASLLGHLYLGADVGGVFGDRGGREIGVTVGYHL